MTTPNTSDNGVTTESLIAELRNLELAHWVDALRSAAHAVRSSAEPT